MSTPLDVLSEPVGYLKFASYSEQRLKTKETSKREHYQKHVIIFGLQWIADGDSGFKFLAACTSKGEILIWKVPMSEAKSDFFKAIFRKTVCKGKLFSIRSELVGAKRLLIVSGDDGVLVFDWEKDLLNTHLHQSSSAGETNLAPAKQFRPYPSPLESRGVEVNEVQVLEQGNSAFLFGAGGDSFGVYKWDLETGQLLSNYSSPGSGYLHSIAILPSDRPGTLLAGSEAGKLELWDVHQDRSMAQIDLTSVTAADASSSSSASAVGANPASRKRAKTMPSRFVTSICAYDANWFTVAGGSCGNSAGTGFTRTNSIGGGIGNGFLATYHEPTRSLVSWADTREIPQQLAVLPSGMESSVQHSVLSVANEGVVSQFNALSLNVTRRQWCSPPSAYATAVSEDGKFTAIGGVGCLVDVFDSTGEKTFTLSIC